jgi:predicted nuclease of predicted toxin-antitoxin system
MNDFVLSEGLAGSDDSRVWAAAQADGRFLIKQEFDFADVRRFVPGSHHRCSSCAFGRLEPGCSSSVTQAYVTEPMERWPGKTVIASDRKARAHG